MRIAVSGTHASGKSTLIGDFVDAHPNFASIPEPYEFLDATGEGADALSFRRQFTTSVQLLFDPTIRRDAVFERSPLDFIAYLAALATLGRPTVSSLEMADLADRAEVALREIDLLAVVALDQYLALHLDEEEDEPLRAAMNAELLDLVDRASGGPEVVEIAGPREFRLGELTRAYETWPRSREWPRFT